MTVRAIEGVAGAGKTHRLIEVLGETLTETPLQAGQGVLALTFMHGARRRLDERLRKSQQLAGRFECGTIDSFAWRLWRRWRSLTTLLGLDQPQESDFDGQCELVGTLLERPEVRAWVAASYPIILVDEAQDLRPQRLRMIRALNEVSTVLVAADEFQCLDSTLRPNPLVTWLTTVCEPEVLAGVRRTDRPGLLAAAQALRNGAGPVAHGDFRLIPVPSAPMAAACLANAIAWSHGGTVAVITPSIQGGFVREVVHRVCAGPCGQQGNGPYPIRWESSEQQEVDDLLDGLVLADPCSGEEAMHALEATSQRAAIRQTVKWLRRQEHAHGRTQFGRAEIESIVARQVSQRRRFSAADGYGLPALTVQQAKNREFDGVVAVWPYQVGGDAESKRRLLYNAITRARRWCTVLVQGKALPNGPPFV